MSADLQIIGLDGCDPYLLKEWIDRGLLPNFEKIVNKGYFGKLRSTVPPTTFPAWITMFTGMNPGQLGVFDFFDFKRTEEGYSQELYTTRRWEGEYVWNKTDSAGLSTGILNIPFFMPSKINGYMIDMHMSNSYPSNFLDGLSESYPYVSEFDTNISPTKKMEIIRIKKNTEIELNLGRELQRSRETDLFIQVFNVLDSTAHCTNSIEVLRDRYMMMDRAVGEYFELEGVNTLFVSDHGMKRVKDRFYLNKWLRDEKMLKLKQEYDASSFLELISYKITNLMPSLELFFDDIFSRLKGKGRPILNTEKVAWGETMAYAHSPNATGYYGLWLTDEGVLKEKEIMEKIMKIRINRGKNKLVDRYFRSQELYEGSKVDALPRIILKLVDEVLAMSTFAPVRSRATNSFAHSIEGTIIAYGPDIIPGKPTVSEKIEDIAPTILSLLGIPKPENIDGERIKNMLR